jgi:DNA polymerase-1
MKPGVGFDIETASADEIWSYGDGFVRLMGYTDNDGNTAITEDVVELSKVLNDAPWIYAHNFFGFDGLALSYHYPELFDWNKLSAKALDTLILARLDFPPEARSTGVSKDKYTLDICCERKGIPGKLDIDDLVKEFGGWDNIPLDDPRFIAYLTQDVNAIKGLIDVLPRTPYAKREHHVAAINGAATLNGFRVDIPLLNERLSQGEELKRQCLEILRDDYDLPLGKFRWKGRGDKKEEYWEDFDSPLSTLDGRQWMLDIFDAYGVRNPPRTSDGRIAIGSDALAPLRESPASHPDLRRILELISIVTGTRTVYQTLEDHMVDGWVHPLITMGQASGRSSVTNPGLTVFGKRGGRFIERMVLLPDNDDEALLSIDFQQADMRAVAGLSQDPNYMKLVERGRDPHTELAIQMFGDAAFRQQVKPIAHGANYGEGANKLIAAGHDPLKVARFFEERKRLYPRVMEWQDEVRDIGRAGKLLDDGFGRPMRCDPARAYTQAPALMGQGAAGEFLREALLRMDAKDSRYRNMLKITVHDEGVFSVPKKDFYEIRADLMDAFEFEWRGVPILADASDPGENWGEISAH